MNHSSVVYSMHFFLSSPLVPGDIRNLSLSHNGSHFLILWLDPVDPNGAVRYLVNLTCTDLFRGTTSDVVTLRQTVDLELVVMGVFLPYTRCLVMVAPLTTAGQGSTSTQTLVSDEEGKRLCAFSCGS